METRKVQRINTTFIVSLPREWAVENGLRAGVEVAIDATEHALRLTPVDDGGPATVTVDERDWAGHPGAAVTALYHNGYDSILLEGDGITADQRETVERAVRPLPEVELLETDDRRLGVHTLATGQAASVYYGTASLHALARSRLNAAAVVLRGEDPDPALDDERVDRLWHTVTRAARARLDDRDDEADLPRERIPDFHDAARQLRSVATVAATIVERGRDLDDRPDAALAAVATLAVDVGDALRRAVDALFRDEDVERADAARAAAADLGAQARAVHARLHDLPDRTRRRLGRIVDALARCAEHASNVADVARFAAAERSLRGDSTPSATLT
ncbi:AbrB/MazE/SpoVT family DNA-binding domain-containing protein [Halobacteriaceae archaeon GCM10025711]